MKAKITRKDGTVIELEGTAEELARFIEEPRIEITAAPAPAVDWKKLLEDAAKADEEQRQKGWWQGGGCPGIVPLPFRLDPCPGGVHDFPSPWLGLFPPACTRCGLSAAPFTQIICQTNEGLGMLRLTASDNTLTP